MWPQILPHLKRVDYDLLNELLSREDWSTTLQETDVNIAMEIFFNTMQRNINKATTIKRIPAKTRKLNPWMTNSDVTRA